MLLSFGGEAVAADSIRISYDSGYPIPSLSSQALQILITRVPTGDVRPDNPTEIDSYFANIQRILDVAHTPVHWSPPQALHVPRVTVEIENGGRKYTLNTSYGVDGPELPLASSESDRRQLVALKEIIRLTTARLGPLLLGR
jgi:hypothetical protein